MTEVDPYNATLLEREDLHGALAIFKVRFDSGEGPDFEPGQFTNLGLIDPDAPPPRPNSPASRRKGPRLIRRAYSIASSPKLKSHLEFFIVRIDGGKFTTPLWKLGPGDPVFMDPKIKGTFTLDGIPDGRDLVMVGTGTGVAPFWSMLNTYRHTGRWRKLILLDGCRYARDLGYYEQLSKTAAEDGSIIYLPTVTREPDDAPWAGLRGRVHGILEPGRFAELTGVTLDPNRCHVLLCGSPRMIEQATEHLDKLGFITRDREHPNGNIHFERYW
jgi:ferredoxin/flavodoxin---NADP+ reductase